jgi:hypothetical protein
VSEWTGWDYTCDYTWDYTCDYNRTPLLSTALLSVVHLCSQRASRGRTPQEASCSDWAVRASSKTGLSKLHNLGLHGWSDGRVHQQPSLHNSSPSSVISYSASAIARPFRVFHNVTPPPSPLMLVNE